MQIETKYNIGDKVWFNTLGYNKCAIIDSINIIVLFDNEVNIEYSLSTKAHFYQRRETDIFPTKEELLKNL